MDSDQGKLFIGGISWETSEDKLKEYFGSYGEVSQAVVMRDKATGRPRGFGFVVFADPSILDRVLQEKHIIDGRTVNHPSLPFSRYFAFWVLLFPFYFYCLLMFHFVYLSVIILLSFWILLLELIISIWWILFMVFLLLRCWWGFSVVQTDFNFIACYWFSLLVDFVSCIFTTLGLWAFLFNSFFNFLIFWLPSFQKIKINKFWRCLCVVLGYYLCD